MFVMIETLRFLNQDEVRVLAARYGSPVYVYDLETLRRQAQAALAFPNAYGLTVRYAMKAASNAAILRVLTEQGLLIDASSGWECQRALRAGVPAAHISLSTQELPQDIEELLRLGIHCNACSLYQLEQIGRLFPGSTTGVRFNPGLGSGSSGKTNVGGPASSFGIWHEQAEQVAQIAREYGLKITRIHTHIGSGSDPQVWSKVALLSLALVEQFEEVTTLNLGGGFKVARMADETGTDLQLIGAPVKQAFEALAARTGRKLHLEIEPGTFLLANSGALLARVQDKVDTGAEGYTFLKLNCGMTEILRPSLYASQHPLVVVPAAGENDESAVEEVVVVGHCCESGDLLTPAADDPEALQPRRMHKAQIGDWCVIEGAGAYCSSMSSSNYNSFPQAAEVLRLQAGEYALIRERQTLEQMLANEKVVDIG